MSKQVSDKQGHIQTSEGLSYILGIAKTYASESIRENLHNIESFESPKTKGEQIHPSQNPKTDEQIQTFLNPKTNK